MEPICRAVKESYGGKKAGKARTYSSSRERNGGRNPKWGSEEELDPSIWRMLRGQIEMNGQRLLCCLSAFPC